MDECLLYGDCIYDINPHFERNANPNTSSRNPDQTFTEKDLKKLFKAFPEWQKLITENLGYPLWDDAFYEKNGYIYTIPFVLKESSAIEGLLQINFIENSIDYYFKVIDFDEVIRKITSEQLDKMDFNTFTDFYYQARYVCPEALPVETSESAREIESQRWAVLSSEYFNRTSTIFGLPFDPCLNGCECPDTFDPVCGANGVTYYNSCTAECHGISYVTGSCNSNDGSSGSGPTTTNGDITTTYLGETTELCEYIDPCDIIGPRDLVTQCSYTVWQHTHTDPENLTVSSWITVQQHVCWTVDLSTGEVVYDPPQGPQDGQTGGGSSGSNGSGSTGNNNTENNDPDDEDEEVEDAWASSVPFNLCIGEFTYIGNGRYLNYTNLDYNFLHNSTGVTIKVNATQLCIQLPDTYSETYTINKFNSAMDKAVRDTRNYLNVRYNQNSAVNPSEINLVWRRNIGDGINTYFGSSGSTSSNCNGVPTQAAYWAC